MNEIIAFTLEHWVLSTIFFTILIVIIILEAQKANDKSSISPEHLVNLINHKNAIIIDIRNTDVYKQGHIIGAKNILPTDINKNNKKLLKYSKKHVVMVCKNGAHSLKIASQLKNMGFANTYALKSGMLAWNKENLPLSKD